MRPVDRGGWPTKANSTTGKPRVFSDWTKAIEPLRERTGPFCHLCEMHVTNQLAIEHIKSREGFPRLAGHWDNFLLSCSHCNSRKRAAPVQVPYRKKYVWPHIHNTLLAFEVALTGQDFGIIQTRSSLGAATAMAQRAGNTIQLYALDQRVTKSGGADHRYTGRVKAISMATARRLEMAAGKATVQAIVDMAKTSGYFNVWYTVFANVPQVKAALVRESEFALQIAWFDAKLDPIPRLPAEGI